MMLNVFLGGFERDFGVFHGRRLADGPLHSQIRALDRQPGPPHLLPPEAHGRLGPIEPPQISVLIPAYNEERLIAAVLAQVHASFAAAGEGFAYEIIVCDNHSTDHTAAVARAHGAQVVYEPHNQISRARNAAARAARGRWLIFLDADTLLPPEVLAETLNRLAGGAVCAGGAVLRFDTAELGLFASGLTGFWNWLSPRFGLAAGSYLFCRREAWEETGGFDERVYAGEELLFSRRLSQWARAHGLRFEVLTKTPVVTSARKLQWYGQWQLIWRMMLLARPGALRDPRQCTLWYTRPPEEIVAK
jgi:cellulose synthase/poly-beta-1,6-N-acetylglucosamine synthase-like glycosyltransferase